MAGATAAITFVPLLSQSITSQISDLSVIAPKGHAVLHVPQDVQMSLSMIEFLEGPGFMASAGHERSQGLLTSTMA
jgi:hypothetical protein